MERIHLYQFHAVDPRTPLATSVRALAALKEERLVERIGLCNVNVRQIEEARRIAEISAVQVELSLWHDTNVLNGVVRYCIDHSIELIAYRPLGGSRPSRRVLEEPALKEVAERHGAPRPGSRSRGSTIFPTSSSRSRDRHESRLCDRSSGRTTSS